MEAYKFKLFCEKDKFEMFGHLIGYGDGLRMKYTCPICGASVSLKDTESGCPTKVSKGC